MTWYMVCDVNREDVDAGEVVQADNPIQASSTYAARRHERDPEITEWETAVYVLGPDGIIDSGYQVKRHHVTAEMAVQFRVED